MKKLISSIAILVSIAASASAITLDLSVGPVGQDNKNGFVYGNIDGTGISATALALKGNDANAVRTDVNKERVYRSADGLGVFSASSEGGTKFDIGNRTDQNEILEIVFSEAVRILGFTIAKLDDDDAGFVNLDGGLLSSWANSVGPAASLFIPTDSVGTQLRYSYEDNNGQTSYVVRSVEFSSVPDSGATVALLGVGLLGLVACRKRFAK